jgi:uncharacterized membrane protein (DUF4010 family)
VNPQLQAAIGVLIATLGGLAVGLEREWSGHASGPHARFAGVRTFTLLGLLGGISGWMWSQGEQLLPATLLFGAVALIVAAYTVASRHDVEGTTEVAALVVLAAALLAGTHHWEAAAAIIAVTTLLLVEKSRIHGIVRSLDDASLRAAARFAVMAIVILPMLPPGPYGPWGGFRPRLLWIFVLFFSGLNFAGYIARRIVGESTGYLLTGLLGGFLSSSSVTIVNSRLSRSEKSHGPLASGALAACTVICFRVLLASTVLNPALARALALYLVLPVLVGATITFINMRQPAAPRASVHPPSPQNPLQFFAALRMTVLFQAVFYAVFWLRQLFPGAGLLASGALVGLVDMDALTISMSRLGSEVSVDLAARAIVVGLIADAAVKLILAVALGQGAFRRAVAVGLAGIAASLAVSLPLVHRLLGN